jgi:uncharacterized protein (TIGR02453 family)
MPARFTSFQPEALAFLRALKRNNDREWFRARKDQYERLLRAPMLALVQQLATDFRTFAPELVASEKSLYRIYRDTRFSEDKRPLKTHVAAVFPHRGLSKNTGAALYVHVGADEVFIGGGMHSPDTPQLVAIREHIASNLKRFRAIVESPAFRRTGGLWGERLQRVPRGYAKDDEAAEYLRYRQFLAGGERPAKLATDRRFYSEVIGTFRRIAPLVRFLNEPLLKG